MKNPPYSFIEAQKFRAAHLQVIGKNFDSIAHENAIIEQIVVTPHDDANKNRFFLYFQLVHDAETIINQEYSGLHYDVLVIARSPKDDNEILHMDLFSWMNKNNDTSIRNNIADALKASLKTKTEEFYK